MRKNLAWGRAPNWLFNTKCSTLKSCIHTRNVTWIEKVIFIYLGIYNIIYDMMYMYNSNKKNVCQDLRLRKGVCAWGGLEGGKEREKWYISVSKSKNIKRVSKRNGINLTNRDLFFQYRCSAF